MGSGDVVACILNFASGKVSVQLHALDALIPGIWSRWASEPVCIS